MYSSKDWSKGKYFLLKWSLVLIMFLVILSLEYRWRRMVHIITGFMWWGMVFFLTIILLPKIGRMKKNTQFEIIGYLIPRIFRTVSVVAFYAVFIGWYNTLNDLSNWNLNYFTLRIENILFFVSILLVTGLYLFHLFLENREINLAFFILESSDTEITEKADELIRKIQKIPYVGFTILTIAVIMMFIH